MLTDHFDTEGALHRRINAADERYGNFASVQEAMGVCLEEWHELIEAAHGNDRGMIRYECLDLAAALIRLHDQLEGESKLRERSGM
jgi:hypothetical protein